MLVCVSDIERGRVTLWPAHVCMKLYVEMSLCSVYWWMMSDVFNGVLCMCLYAVCISGWRRILLQGMSWVVLNEQLPEMWSQNRCLGLETLVLFLRPWPWFLVFRPSYCSWETMILFSRLWSWSLDHSLVLEIVILISKPWSWCSFSWSQGHGLVL